LTVLFFKTGARKYPSQLPKKIGCQIVFEVIVPTITEMVDIMKR